MKFGKIVDTINRKCMVCGKEIIINLNKKGKYDNSHYFNKLTAHVGKGKYVKGGTFKFFENEKPVDVVKWTGKKKKVEYWECNKCFQEGQDEMSSL